MLAIMRRIDRLLGAPFQPDSEVNGIRFELQRINDRLSGRTREIDVKTKKLLELNITLDGLIEDQWRIAGDYDAMMDLDVNLSERRREIAELELAIKKLKTDCLPAETEKNKLEAKLNIKKSEGRVAVLKFGDSIQKNMYDEICKWDADEIRSVAMLAKRVQVFFADPTEHNFSQISMERNEDLGRKLEELKHNFIVQKHLQGIDHSRSSEAKSSPASFIEKCFITVLAAVLHGFTYEQTMSAMKSNIREIKDANTGSSSIVNCNLFTVLDSMENSGWFA